MPYIQKRPHAQLLAYHLLQNLKNVSLWTSKFYKGKILFHMIDHATRFSVTVILSSKKPDQVVNVIMKNCVAVYGTVDKFLTDNGG